MKYINDTNHHVIPRSMHVYTFTYISVSRSSGRLEKLIHPDFCVTANHVAPSQPSHHVWLARMSERGSCTPVAED